MNAKMIIGVVVVAALIGVGMLYVSRTAQAPSNNKTIATPAEKTGKSSSQQPEVVVQITKNGFSPSTVVAAKGTKVSFINLDQAPHWPASAMHPQHQCYPEFDPKQEIAPGGLWSFTASMPKQCGFHDHLNPNLRGSLAVTE